MLVTLSSTTNHENLLKIITKFDSVFSEMLIFKVKITECTARKDSTLFISFHKATLLSIYLHIKLSVSTCKNVSQIKWIVLQFPESKNVKSRPVFKINFNEFCVDVTSVPIVLGCCLFIHCTLYFTKLINLFNNLLRSQH